jgi:hypothetical protein
MANRAQPLVDDLYSVDLLCDLSAIASLGLHIYWAFAFCGGLGGFGKLVN